VSNVPNPGLARQERYRTGFRIAGIIALLGVAACVYLGIQGIRELDASFDSGGGSACLEDGSFPRMENCDKESRSDNTLASPFWFFGAVPLFAVAGFSLQAGFMGAAARYGAGETMPVVRDSAAYLTHGEGILGVGRTVGDPPGARSGVTGPFCTKCGVRNDEGARFCDACGTALG